MDLSFFHHLEYIKSMLIFFVLKSVVVAKFTYLNYTLTLQRVLLLLACQVDKITLIQFMDKPIKISRQREVANIQMDLFAEVIDGS